MKGVERFFVIGASGQLGSELARQLPPQQVIALTHEQIELCNHEQVREAISSYRADVVINCAAYNLVDEAEDEAERAFAVNSFAVLNLARACNEVGSVLVHISTDYVFDGRKGSPYIETDAPNPVNVYGVSKLAGEYFVRLACPKHFIVRTSALYGFVGRKPAAGNFVERMLRQARQGQPLRVVNDRFTRPTFAKDLAAKILELVNSHAYGLYHITNAGECSWYDFTRSILKIVGVEAALIPVSSHELKTKAKRPAYSILDNFNLRALGFTELRHWREALREYLGLQSEKCGSVGLGQGSMEVGQGSMEVG